MTNVQHDAVTRQQGAKFLMSFYAALRVLKMYPLENDRSQRALDELTAIGQSLLDQDGELEVRITGDFIFVNSTRLRLGLDNYASFSHVVNSFRHSGVGILNAVPGVGRRDWQVFISFMLTIAAREDDTDKLKEFEHRLSQAGVTSITVDHPIEGEGSDLDPEERLAVAKRTYERSVGVTKELVNSARMGRTASLRKVKRAVQNIIDQVLNNEVSMVGLTTIRDYDDYTFTHSVNVCIFSVSVGRRLGLSKLQLYDLGFAALLHDIGKSLVPLEILNKAGGLTDVEWRIMQSHPWLGVISLFSLQKSADIPYRAMIVAYEHHMKVDLAGYPQSKRVRQLSMFSKIVAVADIFDAATSRRVYQTVPMQPDRILREMMVENERIGVDLVLVKALINLTGIYPVGTCVILDTYELAIVHAANSDLGQIHRPVVRVLITSTGERLSPGPIEDLAETTNEGSYKKSIIKVVDPDRYGINPQDHFV